MATLKVGAIALPEPTKVNTTDEIIWSSNTGRSADSGKMVGDVIAQKKTLEVEWTNITEDELKIIRDNLSPGFFEITYRDNDSLLTMTAYRSTIQKEHKGYVGGVYYYQTVSVSITQQ
jgi:hypothetical protein